MSRLLLDTHAAVERLSEIANPHGGKSLSAFVAEKGLKP